MNITLTEQPGQFGTDFLPAVAGSKKSKALGDVQTLLRQISVTRQADIRVKAICDETHQKMQISLSTYFSKVKGYRLTYFHDLGRHLLTGKWKKKQKSILAEIVLFLAQTLDIEHREDVTDDLCRYMGKPRGFYSEEELSFDDMDDFLSSEFDFEDSNPETVEARLREENKTSSEESVNSSGANDSSSTKGSRGKTKKASKAKPKEAGGPDLLSDIRTLYLMLARALHPDKELDGIRRGEKTVWMQQVTSAYAAKNLGQLLDILAQNPLNALGPYLETTPEATLRGFAKRLRRELTSMHKQRESIFRSYSPQMAGFFKQGVFSEAAYRAWEDHLKKGMVAMKERVKGYKTIEGVLDLFNMVQYHDLESLL
jgi:hypothetical protein